MSLSTKIGALAAAGVAVMTLAFGCSSTEEIPAADNPFATESKFCAELAAALCSDQLVSTCYGGSDDDNVETCQANAQIKACNPGRLTYRSAGAESCIAALKAAYADARLSAEEVAKIDLQCHAALSGIGSEGSSCSVDGDCDGSEGLFCVGAESSNGSCQVPETVDPGLSCAADSARCGDGFYCGQDDSCIQRPGAGQACCLATSDGSGGSSASGGAATGGAAAGGGGGAGGTGGSSAADSACAPLKPCDGDTLCVANKCELKLPDGQACTSSSACAGGFCQGDRCSSSFDIHKGFDTCGPYLP